MGRNIIPSDIYRHFFYIIKMCSQAIFGENAYFGDLPDIWIWFEPIILTISKYTAPLIVWMAPKSRKPSYPLHSWILHNFGRFIMTAMLLSIPPTSKPHTSMPDFFTHLLQKFTLFLPPVIFMIRFLPKQSSLTIYNTSQLYINLEGCVNTLRGECLEFLHSHGRDGDNNTAQSRFQCYYNKVSVCNSPWKNASKSMLFEYVIWFGYFRMIQRKY